MAIEKFIFLLWFLRLFKPEWIISQYIPGLGFIKAIPTVILYGVFFYALTSKRKIVVDKPYLIFFAVTVISMVFAVNRGMASQAVRAFADSLLFYLLSISFLNSEKNTDKLFSLYFGSLIFYGIAGLASGGRISFHVVLSEEDAFGPLMAMGVPLAFHAALGIDTMRYGRLFTTLLCLGGVIASFARGAFISLCVGGLYIWYKFQRKIVATVLLALFGVVTVVVAGLLFSNNAYWNEMLTIVDSYKSGSKNEDEGRKFLWRKGIEMFVENPLMGVGPANYGFVLPKITKLEEIEPRDVRLSEIYGRVPHSIYIRVLAEFGLLGAMSMLIIIAGFWKKNRFIQKDCKKWKKSDTEDFQSSAETRKLYNKSYHYAVGLNGAFIVYLVNGLFYDLLYVTWLPDLLILNSLVYSNYKAGQAIENRA